jgi:hypothetical protein
MVHEMMMIRCRFIPNQFSDALVIHHLSPTRVPTTVIDPWL